MTKNVFFNNCLCIKKLVFSHFKGGCQPRPILLIDVSPLPDNLYFKKNVYNANISEPNGHEFLYFYFFHILRFSDISIFGSGRVKLIFDPIFSLKTAQFLYIYCFKAPGIDWQSNLCKFST